MAVDLDKLPPNPYYEDSRYRVIVQYDHYEDRWLYYIQELISSIFKVKWVKIVRDHEYGTYYCFSDPEKAVEFIHTRVAKSKEADERHKKKVFLQKLGY